LKKATSVSSENSRFIYLTYYRSSKLTNFSAAVGWQFNADIEKKNKKAVLSQGNRAMPQLLFLV